MFSPWRRDSLGGMEMDWIGGWTLSAMVAYRPVLSLANREGSWSAISHQP